MLFYNQFEIVEKSWIGFRDKDTQMKKSIGIFDIDGTLRQTVDPWMLLHNHLGTAQQGEKFYKLWVSGEITYTEMTELDVSIWKDCQKDTMLSCLNLNPIRKGAHQLIEWFKKKNIPCVGISTGLSFLNEVTKAELGLDEIISNEIYFKNGKCTGKVKINVHEDGKEQVMKTILEKYGIDRGEIITFGDGPADIAMFEMSTFSVAVFPRTQEVINAAKVVIESEPINPIINQLKQLNL